MALVLISFLSGSIPFSVWLGRLFLGIDVRQVGDRNPGAANAYKSGNKALGMLVLILDVAKAAAPVGLAYHNLGLRGFPMFLVALAPILGHMMSPFLGFRGGKALATTLGVWIGLTIWKASLAAVITILLGTALVTPVGWAVLIGLAGILVTLLAWIPDPLFLLVWAGAVLLLGWAHRSDLRKRPRLRPWLAKRLSEPVK